MLVIFLVLLIVALSPILAFNGLTVSELLQWFNHHPFLSILILRYLFGSFVVNTHTNKSKEIV